MVIHTDLVSERREREKEKAVVSQCEVYADFSKSFFSSFFPRLCQRRIEERKSASWGERCVDVFSNLEIIGEGTYGLVYKAKDTTLGKRYFMSIYVAHKRLLCGVHVCSQIVSGELLHKKWSQIRRITGCFTQYEILWYVTSY